MTPTFWRSIPKLGFPTGPDLTRVPQVMVMILRRADFGVFLELQLYGRSYFWLRKKKRKKGKKEKEKMGKEKTMKNMRKSPLSQDTNLYFTKNKFKLLV
jgi:hypothetical protein